MATEQIGPIKITVPAPLSKNEKDIICMILAGRLKDLWSGKLACFELALDELIKDTVGSSALDNIRDGLGQLKNAVDDFKEQSGYDKILGDVNAALGKLSDVFSLGGLCPSPITPPKIPDVLAQLNANLFGQANNILNALGSVPNPAVCIGGGPGGIGVDWNNMPGMLNDLKNAIQQFKNDPAGFSRVMSAFENNINRQTKRLKSELDRLKQNLSDPLGIQKKRNSAASLQYTKNNSDALPVMDKNGVTHKNIAASMTSGEMQAILNRTDAASVLPVTYVLKEVLDYCGDVIGLEKVITSGDAAYAPHDMLYDDVNNFQGTALPKSTYENFDFYFTDVSGATVVYNTLGEDVTSGLRIERGISYLIGFDLYNEKFELVKNGKWIMGLEYLDFTYNPAVTRVEDPSALYYDGELTWNVFPEELATIDSMEFVSTNGTVIPVDIYGTTVNPNKSYDLANLIKKSLLHLKSEDVSTADLVIPELVTDTSKTYRQTTTIIDGTGAESQTVTTLTYGSGYKIIQDEEIDNTTGTTDPDKKILVSTQLLSNGLYLITRLHVTDAGSIDITQLNFYLATDSNGNNPDTRYLSCYIKFKDSIYITNDGVLTDTKTLQETYSWMAAYTLNGETVFATKETFETGVFSIDEANEAITLKMHYGNATILGDLQISFEFKLRSNGDDMIDRTFEKTTPYLNKMSFAAKGPGANKIVITQEKV